MFRLPSSSFTVTELCQPISKETPTGQDIYADNDLQNLKTKRRALLEKDLPEGVWHTASDYNWSDIEKTSARLLLDKTKDLHVVFHLWEAWTALRGMEGLSQGALLTHHLIKTFQSTLHPAIKKQGDTEHFELLNEWIDDALATALLTAHVCKPDDSSYQIYTLFDLTSHTQQKRNSQNQDEQKKEIQNSVRTTSCQFYDQSLLSLEKTLDDLILCKKSLNQHAHSKDLVCFKSTENRLNQLRDVFEKLKLQAKPLPIKKKNPKAQALGNFLNALTRPSQKKSEHSDEEKRSLEEEKKKKDSASQENPGEISSQFLSSRETAYEKIHEAALFLMKQEPQSPVPYLLKTIYSWQEKNFQEILQEIKNAQEKKGWPFSSS